MSQQPTNPSAEQPAPTTNPDRTDKHQDLDGWKEAEAEDRQNRLDVAAIAGWYEHYEGPMSWQEFFDDNYRRYYSAPELDDSSVSDPPDAPTPYALGVDPLLAAMDLTQLRERELIHPHERAAIAAARDYQREHGRWDSFDAAVDRADHLRWLAGMGEAQQDDYLHEHPDDAPAVADIRAGRAARLAEDLAETSDGW